MNEIAKAALCLAPMTLQFVRASSYSLMVAERKSKSFASVARGKIFRWEKTVLAPALGGRRVTQ